jgi:UDP-N-acetylglucosamine 2-epimerase (non-hydrolysing)
VVLVHGDTATTLSAALAAFYSRLRVGHVEAGLRSFDMTNPFPEEANRILTDQLATFCYAPTETNRDNLLRENVDARRIVVTGNTAIDALLLTREQVVTRPESHWRERLSGVPEAALAPENKLVVVTAHRRENFGPLLAQIFDAIKWLARHHPDWHFVYPVHPNPNVLRTAHELLGGLPNVHLIDPVDYEPFVFLLDRAFLVLTDSGGVQEEAPSLGKPVVVLRETTERREGIHAGCVVLAGTDRQRIVDIVQELGSDSARYAAMATSKNPYGDGRAAQRIVEHLRKVL